MNLMAVVLLSLVVAVVAVPAVASLFDKMRAGLIAGAIVVGLAVAFVALLGALDRTNPYSTGVRVGEVQKATDKGVLFKTREVEIVTEGHRVSGNSMTNVWEATVYDPTLFERVRSLTGPHRFSYIQHYAYWPWEAATSYEIVSVEAAK